MNFQVNNLAPPKAEFENASSRKIMPNDSTAIDAAHSEEDFNENTLFKQKDLEKNSTQQLTDDEADSVVTAEATNVDEYSPAETSTLPDGDYLPHYLSNPVQKQNDSEPKFTDEQLSLKPANELLSVIGTQNSGVIQDSEELAEHLMSIKLLSKNDMLSTQAGATQAGATQAGATQAGATQAGVVTSHSKAVLNDFTNEAQNGSKELEVKIELSTLNEIDRFNTQNSNLIAAGIGVDLNSFVSKNSIQLLAAQPVIQPAGLRMQSSAVPTPTSHDGLAAMRGLDAGGDQVSSNKSELVKQSMNTLLGNFNLENRDLSNQKTTIINPLINNSSLADAFEWRQEKLKGAPSEWGQRLLNVLGDKVNLQIGQQVQRAQIRLDPPNLGRIEISISIDGDKTSVSLVTSNPQVREAIAQTLDQLRQTLSQNGSVTIDLSSGDKHQSEGGGSDEEQVAENFSFSEGSEIEVTKELGETSSDWLNRLV